LQAFPNFLQIFAVFLQTFPNFCLAVLWDFKALGGKKFGERPFRFSPNFCPPLRGKFSRKGSPHAAARVDRSEVLICQTTEMQSTTYFEKQKELFVIDRPFRLLWLGRRRPILAPAPAVFWAMGRRGNSGQFAAAMAETA
jgi:hypothetical protein